MDYLKTTPENFSNSNSRNSANSYDERPWGSYTVLDEGKGFKVKRIEVLPGKRLSYQRHARRTEHWLIVQGEGLVTLNDSEIIVRPGQAVDVDLKMSHRIANPGPEKLIFVEIQRGDYLEEDDIERLDDDFGRVMRTNNVS